MIQSRRVPIFCSKREISIYIGCSLLILGSLIGGIYLSTEAAKDIKDLPVMGTIVGAYCTETCLWGCDRSVTLSIEYSIDDVNYTSSYYTSLFEGCPGTNSEGVCCPQLNGLKIHLDVSDSNFHKIIRISMKDSYNTGDHIVDSVILFIVAAFGSCFIGLYIQDKCKKRSYISI
jgi:hypothetical protein